MIRVLLKNIYSGLVATISRRSQPVRPSGGIAYLLSFPGNDVGLIAALQTTFPNEEVVICYTQACAAEAQVYQNRGLRILAIDQPLVFFSQIVPLVTKAQVVICDNYFAFLGDLKLNDATEVYQIWHANGAIKTFGLEDHKTHQRSPSEQARFRRVYQQFTKVLVGSEAMAAIFKASYALKDQQLLPLGVPRTDIYFDQAERGRGDVLFHERFPAAQGQKVVLYVPTYRDQAADPLLDVLAFAATLGSEYLVLSKFHPHTPVPDSLQASAVTDFRGLSLGELLPHVDVLVTDYSSVPFEFALANPQGQVHFYAPDATAYAESTGLQGYYEAWLNAYGTTTAQQLARQIHHNQGLNASQLNQTWNTYNDGRATQRLLAAIKTHLRS